MGWTCFTEAVEDMCGCAHLQSQCLLREIVFTSFRMESPACQSHVCVLCHLVAAEEWLTKMRVLHFVCTGGINDDVVEGLFTSFDSNGDGSIDESERPHLPFLQLSGTIEIMHATMAASHRQEFSWELASLLSAFQLFLATGLQLQICFDT